MKWLIDIIKEWVIAQAYATEAWVLGKDYADRAYVLYILKVATDWVEAQNYLQVAAVNRGDPALYDFDQTDLTLDNAWHDLTLPAIVPENAKVIYLFVRLRATAISRYLQFRTKGHVNIQNRSAPLTQVANVIINADVAVFSSSQNVIQYRASATNINWIRIVVKGWSF